MKKPVSFVLALVLSLSLCVPALAADFSDVPAGHNFYDAILYCAEKGIVGGYEDGTFRPGNTVTRSNFTVMLSRAFFADDVAMYSTPNYLAHGTFYPNYIAMQMAGAVNYTSFAWDLADNAVMSKGISRYDMAQMMTNIMNKKGFAASESGKNAAVSQIADYSQIPSQYKDAVANVYALGIIGGYANGTFGGTVTMNRGQAAVVIYRMMQLFGDTGTEQPAPDPEPKPSVDPVPVTPDEPDPAPVTSTGGMLANGKAITEANVTEILTSLQARYPHGTSFAQGYVGLGSGRNGSSNCIAQIIKNYPSTDGIISTTYGCGGWAAFVADEIFGQTNVTWKQTTMANVRPGDLLIKLDANNKLAHVSVCIGHSENRAPTVRVRVASGNGVINQPTSYTVGWQEAVTADVNYLVYTAYGD